MDKKQLGGVTGKGFVPGQSGNPGGRPKGKSLRARLRDLLEQTTLPTPTGPAAIPDGRQVADLVVESVVRACLKGDVKAMKLLLDLVEPRGEGGSVDCRSALLAEAEAIVDEARSKGPT